MDYSRITERIVTSYDFHSKKEYDEYMEEHPKANKSIHKIVDTKKDTSKDKTDKYEKVRKKVEENIKEKEFDGNLTLSISGSCDMVKGILSAIGGSESFKEKENGRCVGNVSLNKKKADMLLSTLRRK